MQIQVGLRFIDHFFDTAITPGSKVRRSLRQVLGFIDSQCKAEFVNERKAIIDFLKRDPTLTEDEIMESEEAEVNQLKL